MCEKQLRDLEFCLGIRRSNRASSPLTYVHGHRLSLKSSHVLGYWRRRLHMSTMLAPHARRGGAHRAIVSLPPNPRGVASRISSGQARLLHTLDGTQRHTPPLPRSARAARTGYMPCPSSLQVARPPVLLVASGVNPPHLLGSLVWSTPLHPLSQRSAALAAGENGFRRAPASTLKRRSRSCACWRCACRSEGRSSRCCGGQPSRSHLQASATPHAACTRWPGAS